MSVFETYQHAFEFNRGRTLSLLDRVEATADPQRCLAWRPGQGRAHVAWQLMHIGITEAIFAAERLATKEGRYRELWERFRGGSTPDNEIPTTAEIRAVLAGSREDLLSSLSQKNDSQLDQFAWEARDGRQLTLRNVLQIINWHEAHHQGQAHITLNLFSSSCSA